MDEIKELLELGMNDRSCCPMLAKESQIADAMGLEPDEYEHLKGPVDPEVLGFEDLTDMYADWHVNRMFALAEKRVGMQLPKWYFHNIKIACAALEAMIKEIEQGKYVCHLQNLVNVKLVLARFDERAEFQGMRFDGNFKTSAELLKPQLDKLYWLVTKRLHTVFLTRVATIKKETRVSIGI